MESRSRSYSGGQNPEERENMRTYWEGHAVQPTIENMMLDNNAALLHQKEFPEMTSLIPPFEGKRILELASGIGRFTAHFAQSAKNVVSIDFMENFVEKNRETNSHFGNVEFICGDVTGDECCGFENNSFDIVFSCWLLMYLADEEVFFAATRWLNWLEVGGHVVFRESCFSQSGDVRRDFNPSKYRAPSFYTAAFMSVSNSVDNTRFELLSCRNIESYVEMKGNRSQIAWILRKVKTTEVESSHSFQEFLDSYQYSKNGILRYEKIFGSGFLSTGGVTTTKEFVSLLNLQPGQEVLDVGCGLGGGGFYMANSYNVKVYGIDLSTNMVNLAFDRARHEPKECKTVFEITDATTKNFKDDRFDVVYSRDTILHIKDKLSLFRRFLACMKPGGTLMISDYCRGEGEGSPDFNAYVKSRGYYLLSVRDYGLLLEEAGFVQVDAQDRTNQFVDVLNYEMDKLKSNSDDFLGEFAQKDYDDLIIGWESKVKRCGEGDQKWGLFIAKKSL